MKWTQNETNPHARTKMLLVKIQKKKRQKNGFEE